jgi:hypothetical protein
MTQMQYPLRRKISTTVPFDLLTYDEDDAVKGSPDAEVELTLFALPVSSVEIQILA